MRSYEQLCAAIRGEPLPLAIVDLDALDRNVDTLLKDVRAKKKRLRIASKSVRCPRLIEHIMSRDDAFFGVMAYAAAEAAFLVERGINDVLIAYPTLQPSDVRLIAALNTRATVSIVVDNVVHLNALSAHALKGVDIPVVIEADMSLRTAAGALHLGVRRSPLHDADAVIQMAERAANTPGLKVHGVMAYEAQVAGLPDRNPFAPLMNPPKRLIKKISKGQVKKTRAAIAKGLAERGIELELFNGGGTGSLKWASEEDALTEVTAGSGFLCSHLFDYYRDFSVEPAAMYAIQSVRYAAEDIITCHGGGFIASGEVGPDRQPIPHLPRGLQLLPMEGAGEVQTPMKLPGGLHLELGAPVFMRHAKAGELAEHFNEYLLIRENKIVERAKTYRGEGQCFL